MKENNNITSKYKRYDRRFKYSENIETFSLNDKELIKYFDSVKKQIMKIYSSENENHFNISQLGDTTVLIKYINQIFEKIKETRVYYEENHYNPKSNSRNPLLQNLIDEYLQNTNDLKKKFIKNYNKKYNVQFRGAWKYIDINDTSSNVMFDNNISKILRNIEEISELENLLDSTNYRDGNLFLLCINYKYDFENIEEESLNVSSEYRVLKEYLTINNIRHIVLLNPYKELFELVLKYYKPNKSHYIGHGENDFLVFRSNKQVTSDDILTYLDRSQPIFFVINACNSDIISRNLSTIDSLWSVGYYGKLNNCFATRFSRQLYNNGVLTRTNFRQKYILALTSLGTFPESFRENYRLFQNNAPVF